MKPLANDFITIYHSEPGTKVFTYTPAICILDNGRYVFTGDLGGDDVKNLPEIADLKPLQRRRKRRRA